MIPVNFDYFFLDTVYFHLPALPENEGTIYGVSCYRQIDAAVSVVIT